MKDFEIYQCSDFFMIRLATLPFHHLSLTEEKDIEKLLEFYHNNSLFRESIAIASFDLHLSLKKLEKKIPEEDKKKLFQALVKYLTRACSRATPFGLFSSVGWGTFKDQTEMKFDDRLLKKRVGLSMECLELLTKSVHEQKSIVRHLRVMLNPQIILKNGRALFYKSDAYTSENYFSIKITSAFTLLANSAKKPIKYAKLEEIMIKNFPNMDVEKVNEYLWLLFQNKYLISELGNSRLFANSPNEFFQQTSFLENISEDFKFLRETLQYIEEYEKTFGENAIPLLEIIRKKMVFWDKKAINPLRIDSFYDSQSIALHKNVQRVLEKAAQLFAVISDKMISSDLINFYNFFIEKYGTNRLVPFFDLMGSSQVRKLLTITKEENQKPKIFDALLSLQLGWKEIDLEEIIDKFPSLSNEEEQKYVPSFEVFFDILASSVDDIDRGNFQIVIKGFSPQAGATFGRFFYLWNTNKADEMRKLLEKEETLFPNLMFVEPSFFPDAMKAANVSNGEKLRKFQLPLHFHDPDAKCIDLDDIYVGATSERLYCFSKKWKKELHFSSTIMTNSQLLPPPFRFLLLLSQFHFSNFSEFVLDLFKFSAFVPRIKYKNIIFSPAKWYFNYSFFKLDKEDSNEKVKAMLLSTFEKFKIPSKIRLSDQDNYLLLDWELPQHFELILKHFMLNKEIVLLEVLVNEKDLFLGNNEGKHVTEFVVPMIKREANSLENSVKNYPTTEQTKVLDRILLPGGEWIYAKIFLPAEDSDIFLTTQIQPFLSYLMKKYQINKCFYIRYNEESFHLRLRIQGIAEQLNSHVLPELNKWASELLEKGQLEDFRLCAYEKEVERYGGPQCLEIAERFFTADSLCSMQILSKLDHPFPLHLLASFGIINILHVFFPEIDLMIIFLFPDKDQMNLLEGFRPYSKKALQWIKILFFEEEIENESNLQFYKNCFSITTPALLQLKDLMSNLETEKKVWNNKKSILDSLIHMHCNRLLGLSKTLELKARVQAFHLLEKLNAIKSLTFL